MSHPGVGLRVEPLYNGTLGVWDLGMVSYVSDLSITVASTSYRGKVHGLQRLFSTISANGRDIGASFSVPKTELIHWRTPSQ